MTRSLPEAGPFPFIRPPGRPFDPPAELAFLREHHPVSRLLFPDGHEGWLVTRHDLIREVMGDRDRFSSRQELMRSPLPGPSSESGFRPPPAEPGMFMGMDAPEHTRYRRLLGSRFSVRRMRLLTERIERITADHLDLMAEQGPEVDLLRVYAEPIPGLTMSELLGVPFEDHDTFRHNAHMVNENQVQPEERIAAYRELAEYLRNLVISKRSKPTDDMLSDLTETDLTDDELTGVATLLLGAGLDTTANMIALGAFALLCHPDQAAALGADRSLAQGATDELLRYVSPGHAGARAATEDVELHGQLIKKGEVVILSALGGNHDPNKFPNPDRLDIHRNAVGHLTMGHGVHHCLGQQLARVQMQVAYPALFQRFPEIHLGIPAEEVPIRTNAEVYGVYSLPVVLWN
jgi:cytochrome P450